jgi:hypothetical protein
MRLSHLLLSASLFLAGGVTGSLVAPAYAVGPIPGAAGSITITAKKFDSNHANDREALKAAQISVLNSAEDADGWKLFFIGHLTSAPGSEEVNLVFYDQTPLKPGQPREEVHAYQIHTSAKGKILMADVILKPEEGFKAGAKYNVLITRLINGKEVVYARTALELAK